MNNKERKKESYETPIIEIIGFNLRDSIAESGVNGVSLWEEIW